LGYAIIGLIITPEVKLFTPFFEQNPFPLLSLFLLLSTRLLTIVRLLPCTLFFFTKFLLFKPCCYTTPSYCSTPCFYSLIYYRSMNSCLISQETYLVMACFSLYPMFFTILAHFSSSFHVLRSTTGATGRSGGFIFNPIHLVFIFLKSSLYQSFLRRESWKVWRQWGSLICKP